MPTLERSALGLGLRTAHYRELFEQWPALDYFEIISENFLGDAELPRRNLARVSERYPIVMHGVGLNLLGVDPLDERYLNRLARLADEVDAVFVTDHLCWTGTQAASHHDLLPVPFAADLVEWAAERASYVQQRLGRPFGLENVSSYVQFAGSTLSEADFYARVVASAQCWFMLDINNVYVSATNHGFDARAYLDTIDYGRVLQVHVAGHSRDPRGVLIDTHDHPVPPAVWALYRHAWQRGGPFPTLLEWDDKIPPLQAALEELEKARAARQ